MTAHSSMFSGSRSSTDYVNKISLMCRIQHTAVRVTGAEHKTLEFDESEGEHATEHPWAYERSFEDNGREDAEMIWSILLITV